jgi:hypothetical protein
VVVSLGSRRAWLGGASWWVLGRGRCRAVAACLASSPLQPCAHPAPGEGRLRGAHQDNLSHVSRCVGMLVCGRLRGTGQAVSHATFCFNHGSMAPPSIAGRAEPVPTDVRVDKGGGWEPLSCIALKRQCVQLQGNWVRLLMCILGT